MRQEDYRLERWLAAIFFSLLFLLPVVAEARTPANVPPSRPECSRDVQSGTSTLESDVRCNVRVGPLETSIRVTAASEGGPSC